MKTLKEKIRGRMRKDRPMTTISIRIPEDLIDDLKEMAAMLGFGGYQPLIRSYVSEGMRRDEALLDEPWIRGLQADLRKHGLSEEAIVEIVSTMLQADGMRQLRATGQFESQSEINTTSAHTHSTVSEAVGSATLP